MKRRLIGLAGALSILSCIAGGSTAAAFPLSNGANANSVVGQANFTTGFVPFASDQFFGALEATNRRLFLPSAVLYNAANDTVFVADMHNHRVLRFAVGNGWNGDITANLVLGQPNFTNGGAYDAAPFGAKDTLNATNGCTTTPNACGMSRAYALAWDPARSYLFVADPDNNRVLIWNLSGTLTNGMAAAFVLGQQNFTTKVENSSCTNVAQSPDACSLFAPTGLAWDPTDKRLFVTDSKNHRVVVYNLTATPTNHMAASWVIGQPNFTTRNQWGACGTGAGGAANTCGLKNPSGVAFDDANNRVWVSDTSANRIMMWSIGSGITNGAAANNVFGQPNFTTSTVNTSCGGGSSGETNANACGLGSGGTRVAVDSTNQRLYVSDSGNHRLLIFSTTSITNGKAASNVFGQANLTTGSNPGATNLGGAISRTGLINPLGISYDSDLDQLLVADGGNHRILAYGTTTNNGSAINVSGEVAGQTTTVDGSGNTTVIITGDSGWTYGVVFPPGTTPAAGQTDVIVTVNAGGFSLFPSVAVQATLPAGTTKTVVVGSIDENLCVVDRLNASFNNNGSCSGGTAITVPASGCAVRTVRGENSADGTGPTGLHNITVCRSGNLVSLAGLKHSAVGYLPDWSYPQLEPGVVDAVDGDDIQDGGCNAAGAGSGLLSVLATGGLLLAALAFWRRREGHVVARRRR